MCARLGKSLVELTGLHGHHWRLGSALCYFAPLLPRATFLGRLPFHAPNCASRKSFNDFPPGRIGMSRCLGLPCCQVQSCSPALHRSLCMTKVRGLQVLAAHDKGQGPASTRSRCMTKVRGLQVLARGASCARFAPHPRHTMQVTTRRTCGPFWRQTSSLPHQRSGMASAGTGSPGHTSRRCVHRLGCVLCRRRIAFLAQGRQCCLPSALLARCCSLMDDAYLALHCTACSVRGLCLSLLCPNAVPSL